MGIEAVDAELDVAILLIHSAAKAIATRKQLEALVGYPTTYGDDAFILIKMQEFLADKDIRMRIELLKKRLI